MFSAPEFLDRLDIDINCAKTIGQLNGAMRRMTTNCGLKHVAYLMLQSSGPQTDPISLVTYPADWVEHYCREEYVAIDPAASLATRHIAPTDWSFLNCGSNKVRKLFDEARAHGIGKEGLTIPVRGQFGKTAICSLTSDEAKEDWEALKKAHLPVLLLGSYLVHERVLELTQGQQLQSQKLSPRELDCICYCAKGLRDHDISAKLGISTPVVSAYIQSAKYKLGASTRPNAIARAIKFKIISPDCI